MYSHSFLFIKHTSSFK